MVAPRGCVWLLQWGVRGCSWRGACVVAPGGVHGCSQGGMRGCSAGCVVAPGEACVVALGGCVWLLPGTCMGYDEIRRYDQ